MKRSIPVYPEVNGGVPRPANRNQEFIITGSRIRSALITLSPLPRTLTALTATAQERNGAFALLDQQRSRRLIPKPTGRTGRRMRIPVCRP